MCPDPNSLAWSFYSENGYLYLGRVVLVFVVLAVLLATTIKRRRWFILASGGAVWLAVAFALLILPWLLGLCHYGFTTQILCFRNEARQFYKEHGRFPSSIAEFCGSRVARRLEPSICRYGGKDEWGRRIVYRARADGYIAVALGKDGKSVHNIDYFWRLREKNISHKKDCRLNAELVASDRGDHVTCGK